jgi:hypothetical protein
VPAPLAYVVHAGDAAAAVARACGRVAARRRPCRRRQCGRRQLQVADEARRRVGARYALVVGDDESRREHGGDQAAARVRRAGRCSARAVGAALRIPHELASASRTSRQAEA